MPASVQPSVGTAVSLSRGSARPSAPSRDVGWTSPNGALGFPSSRAASGEVGHGCRRLRAGLLRGPRLPLRAPRRLRHRLPRLPLARARRRSTGRSTTFDAVAADPVRGARRALWIVEQDGSEAHWTFAELSARSNQVANWLREQGVRARRPDRPHARQPGRAVGDAARRDEARRGGHPGDHAARRRRPARPARPRRRPARRRRGVGDRRSSTDVARRLHPDRGRRRARGLAATTATADAAPPDVHARTASPAPTTRCCSTSPPAPRRARSSSSTPTRRTRSGTCRRCTGSGWSPATCTSTSPRRAGRSTRGATCSRRGTPRRRVFVHELRAVRRRRACWTSLDRCGVTSFCAPPTVWRMLIQADLTRPAHARRAKVVGRGRAAQPRGHRAGRAGVGRDDPRRLRPDRDDRADRQHARASR